MLHFSFFYSGFGFSHSNPWIFFECPQWVISNNSSGSHQGVVEYQQQYFLQCLCDCPFLKLYSAGQPLLAFKEYMNLLNLGWTFIMNEKRKSKEQVCYWVPELQVGVSISIIYPISPLYSLFLSEVLLSWWCCGQSLPSWILFCTIIVQYSC